MKKCLNCGNNLLPSRTIPSRLKKGKGKYCSKSCSNKKNAKKGHKNHYWKGGVCKTEGLYTRVYSPDHPSVNKFPYVQEHRLVVEKETGEYLPKESSVHHINEIKDDNRPENLMAFTSESAHQRFHNNKDNVKPEEIIFDGRCL